MADWVVVVDDDTANLKAAGHILSGSGMRVTALKSGRLLLDFLSKGNRPDLVLLDLLMPEMDGFETLRRLHESDARDLPVVFLSASEDDDAVVEGLRLGAMDFIRKPFVPELLVLRVRHMIQLDRFLRGGARDGDATEAET